MGLRPEPQTERNRFIFKIYKEKGSFSKADREFLMKEYNINERRIYQILLQEQKKSSIV